MEETGTTPTKLFVLWWIGYYDEPDELRGVFSSLKKAIDSQHLTKKQRKEVELEPYAYRRKWGFYIEERMLDDV